MNAVLQQSSFDRQDYAGVHVETIEFGQNYCFANLLLKSEFSKKVYSLRR